MKTKKNEIATKGNRKIMLGVRCFSELKAKLIAESKNLDISLSEYCESILQNKDTLLSEKDFANMELALKKENILLIEAKFEEVKFQYKNDILKVNKENDRIMNENDAIKKDFQKVTHENFKLRADLKLLSQQVAIFSDKRLLFLFEKLKGKTDTIYSTNGNKYIIKYNHPIDLLEVMIHSFNIKKQ